MSQHVATGWPNVRNMLRPTMLGNVATVWPGFYIIFSWIQICGDFFYALNKYLLSHKSVSSTVHIRFWTYALVNWNPHPPGPGTDRGIIGAYNHFWSEICPTGVASLHVPTSGNQRDLTAVGNIVLSIYEDGKHRSSVCWGEKAPVVLLETTATQHLADLYSFIIERETEWCCWPCSRRSV